MPSLMDILNSSSQAEERYDAGWGVWPSERDEISDAKLRRQMVLRELQEEARTNTALTAARINNAGKPGFTTFNPDAEVVPALNLDDSLLAPGIAYSGEADRQAAIQKTRDEVKKHQEEKDIDLEFERKKPRLFHGREGDVKASNYKDDKFLLEDVGSTSPTYAPVKPDKTMEQIELEAEAAARGREKAKPEKPPKAKPSGLSASDYRLMKEELKLDGRVAGLLSENDRLTAEYKKLEGHPGRQAKLLETIALNKKAIRKRQGQIIDSYKKKTGGSAKTDFDTIEEAEASNLPPGTLISIGGRRAIVE